LIEDRIARVLRETGRWPLVASQVAGLCGQSPKRAAKDCELLASKDVLKRVALFLQGRMGRPLVAFFHSRSEPLPRMHWHVYYTGLVHVAMQRFWREQALAGEFFYPKETITAGGIMPDATWLTRKGSKTLLSFLELDRGTEALGVLGAKFRKYADYWDRETYAMDFAAAGTLQGFRVCIIVPTGRLPHLLALLRREQVDFVQATTFDALHQKGIGGPIWQTIDHDGLDVLGRAKAGEIVGEQGGHNGAIGNADKRVPAQAVTGGEPAPNTQQEMGTPCSGRRKEAE
jgi:hypothetical protein